MTPENDVILRFSSRVLGSSATDQLRRRKVIQTIRGKSGAKFLLMRGREGWVELDYEPLYRGRIQEARRVASLTSLGQFDAEMGGFQRVDDLRKALKRAGFRFHPLSHYGGFAVEFQAI